MIERAQVIELYTTALPDGSMRNLEDVAAIFGAHPSTIAYHLKQAGIARRPKGQRKIFAYHRAEIVRQYTTPMPDGTWKGSKLIAQELGISDNAVQGVLHEEKIPIRSAKESHAHGKRCGPIKHTEQFDAPPLCKCGCELPVSWRGNVQKWARYLPGHRHHDALYKNEEWLREQYITLNRGTPDIAKEFGVNVSSIIRYLERFGIDRRNASAAHIGKQAGSRNPAWKGGTTPERQRLYKQGHWREFTKQVFVRDGYKCQRCQKGISGDKKRAGAAHHIKSWAEHHDLRFDMSNVITLCRECHLWVHSLANVSREYIG